MAAHDDHITGYVRLPNRGFLRLSGPDRLKFLQGLVSNDVNGVIPDHAVYSCMLTPQGKFLHDFFLIADGESMLIECEVDRRADLAQKLKMYRLRSKVEIAEAEYTVIVGFGDSPAIAGTIVYADPRSPALGTRYLITGEVEATLSFDTYEQLRIAEAAPDGSRDMEVGKAILLENNIDLLNGVAWDKGCYTGQELTARTRYRGLIKKRLVPVAITGTVPAIGTPLIENGAEVGEMRGSAGSAGLALLRLERLRKPGAIVIADATLLPQPPAALAAVIAQPPRD